MKRLTVKEEEIMGWFWQKGPLFVKELLEFYDCPRLGGERFPRP